MQLSRHCLGTYRGKWAHTQLVREHSVTFVSVRWATLDWSWPKEWVSFRKLMSTLKKKQQLRTGNELSDILPRSSHARKKPPPKGIDWEKLSFGHFDEAITAPFCSQGAFQWEIWIPQRPQPDLVRPRTGDLNTNCMVGSSYRESFKTFCCIVSTRPEILRKIEIVSGDIARA